MRDRPLTVDRLRVVADVGQRLREGLSDACELLQLSDHPTSRELSGMRPDLVLVEQSGELESEGLARIAREAGVRSALWITRPPGRVGESSSSLPAAFDVVFATDPRLKLPAGSPPRIGLLHAASARSLRCSTREPDKSGKVGIVLEPGRGWRDQFSPRLDAVLDELTTTHPISVFSRGEVPADIPDWPGTKCEQGEEPDESSFLLSCSAILVAAPHSASSLFMPATAFDAVALGRPVIAVPRISPAYALPKIVAAAGPGQIGPLLRQALDDGEFAPGRRAAGAATVRNEHTYGHRLATIASALSLPVMTSQRSSQSWR